MQRCRIIYISKLIVMLDMGMPVKVRHKIWDVKMLFRTDDGGKVCTLWVADQKKGFKVTVFYGL
jgi:hypothetical protein